MTHIETMKLALDALIFAYHEDAAMEGTEDIIAALQAALEKEPKQSTYGWLIAADEELVCAHLGVAELSDSFETAKVKLKTLIDWHVAVATDPAVNGGFSLQAALAKPSAEPVAWITKGGKGNLWWYQSCTEDGEPNPEDIPLFTHPPVPNPLSDEEIEAIWVESDLDEHDAIEFARKIEAAIRSKT
jgi:hypothetical protein